MQHFKKTTPSNDGVQTIFQEAFLPDEGQSLRAIILIVHGYAEYFGLYHHMLELLTDKGLAVFGIDHWGHGRSSGDKANFTDLDTPIEDLEDYFLEIRGNYPDLPFFVIGHSMGSMLSIVLASRQQDKIRGLILSGTAIHASKGVGQVLRSAVTAIYKLTPELVVQEAGGPVNLTRDPDMTQRWHDDKYNYKGGWKARMSVLLLTLADHTEQLVHGLTLPILLLHGEEDKVTPISGAHYAYQHVQSTDKTIKTYPDMEHEIFNEVERETVFEDVISWIEARL